MQHNSKIGLRITPNDSILELCDDLSSIELIELDFPYFGDGRLFSHARLLRSKLNYQGELRAIGKFLPDQMFFLKRVGVNAFQLEKPEDIELGLASMNDFTIHYQTSTDSL
jgi:uncharacterized protein (DUF934 family)